MSPIFFRLAETVQYLQDFFYVVLVVRIVGSFFPPRTAGVWMRVIGWTVQMTEPVLAPIRRRIPLLGMLDLSALIAIFLVDIAGFILRQLFIFLAVHV
ncbi:MAG: YggT family protein [Firmicutes bacterium]|jgi:YggT family protein|nr:YggT family protein [Bacillota bacterium]